MARTKSAAVAEVLGGDYDPGRNLAPFIATASAWVDDLVVRASQKSVAVTAARLELIERWLAAHAYQQSDPGYVSRSTLDASGSFKGEKGTGFMSTNYGATAVRLDPTGYLREIDGGAEASVEWLGKTPTEQVSYWERD